MSKITVLIFFLSISLTSVAQEIGVNFNEQLDYIDINEINQTKTKWVRGFFDFFYFYNTPSKLNTDAKVTKYLTLQDNGFKTILNIKWDFTNTSFPDTSTVTMTNYKTFLTQILDKIWNKTDIIVVGNEPFIESLTTERNLQLNAFYQSMAKFVNNYRVGKKQIPLYIGAFNRLYLTGQQTTGVKSLLNFAKQNNWIAGVDMHIHHSDLYEIDSVFHFVTPLIRTDQKIIVTEFSLMQYFKTILTNTISSSFATKYSYSNTFQNYQYIDYALKFPVAKQQWFDFLSMSNWFEINKNYLFNAYLKYQSYSNFLVAAYAYRQSYPTNTDFTATTDPWVLNPLFANRSVVINPITSGYEYNYSFIDDFWKIQGFTSKVDTKKITNKIEILQNPVSDFIIILNPSSPKTNYCLFDISGRIVKTSNETTIQISELKPGIYFLYDTSIKIFSKIIKNK